MIPREIFYIPEIVRKRQFERLGIGSSIIIKMDLGELLTVTMWTTFI
jgi:hypothetical protein